MPHKTSLTIILTCLIISFSQAQTKTKKKPLYYSVDADISEKPVPWIIGVDGGVEIGIGEDETFEQYLLGLRLENQIGDRFRLQSVYKHGFSGNERANAYRAQFGGYYTFHEKIEMGKHEAIYLLKRRRGRRPKQRIKIDRDLQTHYSWEAYLGLSSFRHQNNNTQELNSPGSLPDAINNSIEIYGTQVHGIEMGVSRRIRERFFFTIGEQKSNQTSDQRWIFKTILPLSQTADISYLTTTGTQFIDQSDILEDQFENIGFSLGYEGYWSSNHQNSNLFLGFRMNGIAYPALESLPVVVQMGLIIGIGHNRQP